MKKVEHLLKVCETRKQSEVNSLKNLNDENKFRVSRGLIGNKKIFLLESWFVQGNLKQTKQYMSGIGLLHHFAHYPKYKGFGSDHTFGFILCSDNKKIIDACTSLEQSRNPNVAGGGLPWWGNAVANAYLENWEMLEEDCFYIQKNFGKKPSVLSKNTVLFYEALMKGNSDKITEAIQAISSQKYHNRLRDKGELISQFILLPALTYAKLAWIKGYEIEFESDYIPNEWLPIKPLEKYEIPYEFIADHCLDHHLV